MHSALLTMMLKMDLVISLPGVGNMEMQFLWVNCHHCSLLPQSYKGKLGFRYNYPLMLLCFDEINI